MKMIIPEYVSSVSRFEKLDKNGYELDPELLSGYKLDPELLS